MTDARPRSTEVGHDRLRLRLEATATDDDLTAAGEIRRTLVTALDRLIPALHPLIVDARDTSSYPSH
ncbi:MAG TPA: hypothetical protein QF650_00970 [Vicinamibacterales bacterium]|nr:hypothetical protein [Vicinamibacterales bacterium]